MLCQELMRVLFLFFSDHLACDILISVYPWLHEWTLSGLCSTDQRAAVHVMSWFSHSPAEENIDDLKQTKEKEKPGAKLLAWVAKYFMQSD